MNWDLVHAGMAAARSVPDVASQLTSDEARDAGGRDFLSETCLSKEFDWHVGYDHAILLARDKKEPK